MKAKEDLAFLEMLLEKAQICQRWTARFERFNEFEARDRTDDRGNVDLPSDLNEILIPLRDGRIELLRLNAQVQELSRKYNVPVSVPPGHSAAMGRCIDDLQLLIGACQLAVERELHPTPLYLRFGNSVSRAYKAVFKTEKEQVAVRWIFIAALAFGALRIAGINIGDAIKYLIEIWRSKG